jgi:MerR family transcriptional regulator, heat shock protein HspR
MAEAQRFLDPADGGWSWSRRPSRPSRPSLPSAPDGADRGPDAGEDRGAPFVGDVFDGPGPDHDLPAFVISVAAEMSELHPQTLRAYERDGLLSPHRTPGGTRRYSMRDVERLRLIRRLTQDEGLNLAGVRLVLEMGERLEGSRRRIAELEEMVRVLGSRLEQRPAGDRFEIVKAPPAGMELHRSSRRTGTRTAPPVQRARPLPPPDLRANGPQPAEPRT